MKEIVKSDLLFLNIYLNYLNSNDTLYFKTSDELLLLLFIFFRRHITVYKMCLVRR